MAMLAIRGIDKSLSTSYLIAQSSPKFGIVPHNVEISTWHNISHPPTPKPPYHSNGNKAFVIFGHLFLWWIGAHLHIL